MNFNKVKLIIWREYWTRVRKKSFLISTLLTPLAFLALMVGSAYLGSGALSQKKKIVVLDESGLLTQQMDQSRQFDLTSSTDSLESLQEKVKNQEYDYLLHIPQMHADSLISQATVKVIGDQSPGIAVMDNLEDLIAEALHDHNILASGFTAEQIERLDADVRVDVDVLKEGQSENVTNTKIAIGSAIGFTMGFLMYMIIFIYGSFVMRSVMEEKINRIVELIVSTVKPFELMLGKIFGVGLVGFTQVLVWIILLSIGTMIMGAVMGVGAFAGGELTQAMDSLPSEIPQNKFSSVLEELFSIPWTMIIICFLVFFFGGYLMYSSLFAAIGSAIGDDMAEGQSMTLPIVIPVVAAMMMIFPTIEDPQGPIAIFGSLFPLTSPLIMPARLVFEPPVWQILLSIVLLFGACLGLVWLSAKIYRGSILLYGKKLSFKNIWALVTSK